MKNKKRGLFLLSFMDLSTDKPLTMKELGKLGKDIEPIIDKIDCNLIITNRPVNPIGSAEFKRYLKGLLKNVERLEKLK